MNLYQYRNDFFSYQQIGSQQSARAVVPLLIDHLRPASVLDVGCGAGAWTAAYLSHGVESVGLDGGYLHAEQLLFPPCRFLPMDVASPFRLGRSFGLVQCLEVAEHLDPGSSEILVDNLVAHARVVVFSAAPPGQGGEHHVNERPYEFWRGLFRQRGYELFDFVRPRILARADVEPWYRHNMLVFAHPDVTVGLHPDVAACRVPDGVPVRDLSPLGYRLRKRLLSLLPVATVSRMASIKHRLVLRGFAGVQSR